MHRHAARNWAASAVSVAASAWFLWFYLDLWHFGWWPVVVLTGLSVLAMLFWWHDGRRERAHDASMQAFAERNGWRYSAHESRWAHKLKEFPFGQGTHRRDRSVLSGTFAHMECATFVHEFETRTEDHRKAAQVYQITALQLPFPLDTIDIVPDDAMAKVAKFLGGQDIDFESAEFNARWRVKARNAKYAHDVINPRMMHRLNGFDADGVAIRLEKDVIYTWQAGRQGTDTLAKRLSVLRGFARLIPQHVYREYARRYEESRAVSVGVDGDSWAHTPFALTNRQVNLELLHEKHERQLPPIDSGASLDRNVGSYFPVGFFGLGAMDGFGE